MAQPQLILSILLVHNIRIVVPPQHYPLLIVDYKLPQQVLKHILPSITLQ